MNKNVKKIARIIGPFLHEAPFSINAMTGTQYGVDVVVDDEYDSGHVSITFRSDDMAFIEALARQSADLMVTRMKEMRGLAPWQATVDS